MKYKAIMLDLDDTTVLHGRENLPSKRVTDAIARAKERIHVCVATARSLKDAMSIFLHLQLSGPCVITNGTQIYDPVSKKIIYELPLDRSVVHQIYDIAKRLHLPAFLHDGKDENEYTGGEVPAKVLGMYLSEISPSRLDSVADAYKHILNIHVQKLPSWDKRYMGIHITHPNATKLHGIVEVARILHIQTEEIIGVGDQYNDFPLLMACGLKVAMGNAVPELKAIADFIAPSVYDDGVATVIEKFVLTS